jgi:hypothetical protein
MKGYAILKDLACFLIFAVGFNMLFYGYNNWKLNTQESAIII